MDTIAQADIIITCGFEGGFVASDSNPGVLRAWKVDPTIEHYSNSISSFAYVSERLYYAAGVGSNGDKLEAPNRLISLVTDFYAVNPSSLLDDALMLEYRDRDTSLGSTE